MDALERQAIDPDFYRLGCVTDRKEKAVFSVRKLEDEEMQQLHKAKEVCSQLHPCFEALD